jgi:hypothetical protein
MVTLLVPVNGCAHRVCLTGEDQRPTLPSDVASPELVVLIHRCWARAAVDRPSFNSISVETANLLGRLTDITPRPPFLPELTDDGVDWRNELPTVAHSPSLEPTEPLEGASEYPACYS